MKTKVHTMARLVVPFQFKAVVDPASHTFEGFAATWALDLGNDVIKKGAFKNTLKDWKSSGDAIPLLNSHDHYNILSALGQLIDAKETDEGLWTKWELLDGPEGDAVMQRLVPSKTTGRPIVGKMSIGYEPVKFSYEQPEGTTSYWDQIRHLDEVALKETSLVLFPMQPGAAIDPSTVKSFMLSAQATDPRTLDVVTKMELRKLASRIGTLLKKQDPDAPSKADAATTTCPQCSGTGEVADPSNADEMITCDMCDGSGKMPAKGDPETPEDIVSDKKPIVSDNDTEDEKGLKIYEYPEALAQRLSAVRLRNTVSEITK